MVVMPEEWIRAGIVAGVADYEQVVAADSSGNQSLSVTRLESGAAAWNQECINVLPGLLSPCYKVIVDPFSKLLGTIHSYDSKWCNAECRIKYLRGLFQL